MLAMPEPSKFWFVLLTQPQMERKAAARLIADRTKVYLPEETIYARRGVRRRKVEVRRPMFRGYLFVKLGPLDAFGKVAQALGVHKFLRFGDDYATVPDLVMERIFGIEQVLMNPPKVRGPAAIFTPGETVRVSEGTFSGFNAEILKLDDAERITILLPFFGRYTPTQVFAEQLEKL